MLRYAPLFTAILTLAAGRSDAASIRLDELDVTAMTSGWGKTRPNQSVTQTPLSIAGQKFEHGVGTHASSDCWILLDGKATAFSAKVGVDDNARDARGSIEFILFGDDREVWRSGVMKLGEKPRDLRVDLSGIKHLELVVSDGGDGSGWDHADWAEATIEFAGAAPKIAALTPPVEEPVLLTPPAPAVPRINGPRVYGVRPGSPFLFRIPATGERPMSFLAQNLPPGLTLDSKTGIIKGRVAEAGTYRATLTARNARGESQREFRIVVGKQLALTPPMGWNSWYIHYNRVSDRVMREAADQMIASGMADHGYEFVNIDDCWMVKVDSNDPEVGGRRRDDAGRILANKRFPDMKAMTDYIHAKGLKAGTYISPGPRTCAGFEGSYGHEELDARTFADWGFDFLKYDWCSYTEMAGGTALDSLKRPYQKMSSILDGLDRDFVLNLCQYGMGDVWEWGAEVGHCWRTTGDLGLERGARLPGFYNIGFSNAHHWQHAKPGAWNDPDYILIGWVGDAHGMGEGKPTSLTPNEQYSYMSMWCLMAAPLIFSGDMAKLDPFTVNVLCNPEVIDIDQDPLGKQAKVVRQTRREFVLVKDLEDGSKALGLFNLGELPAELSVSWTELGLTGKQRVRDLWRHKDIATLDDKFTSTIPRHGVALVRLWPAQ